MKQRLETLQTTVNEAAGRRKELQGQAKKAREEEKEAKRSRMAKERALAFVREAANEVLEKLNYSISEPVTLALQCVFGERWAVKVAFTPRRNQTECDIWLEENGAPRDPLYNAGGGQADITAFGFQAALLALRNHESGTAPVMILDEPFKHLKGEEANRRAIEMVKLLSDRLGMQVIMVSDERAARADIETGADKVFLVSHNGEKTVMEER